MPFRQLHLRLGTRDPTAVEEALFAAGALSVTLADAADDPILEPLPGATPLWPSVALAALYAEGVAEDEVRRALEVALDAGDLELHWETLEDRAWEREWLKDFRPMRFGRRLWVCPGGQRPPDEAREAVVVELDPGRAVGTGTHATTALCLEWLDSARLAGSRVLDVGCGSGILAVAALVLGAESAFAIDIDPQALLATRENAERNGVAARLAVADAGEPWGEQYDAVLANILAEPLIALAPRLAVATRKAGSLVLSGVLVEQAAGVASAFDPWFHIEAPREREGWAGLVGRRRG